MLFFFSTKNFTSHYVYIGTKADGKKPENEPPGPEPGQS